MRIAIVGAGRMGTHHARVVSLYRHTAVGAVIDVDPLRADLLASSAGCSGSTELEQALSCDAAIVATTPETHLSAAWPFVEAGIPVLVEKPLASDLEEARALVEASEAYGVPITCGFVERFNPVVTTAREVMADTGPAYHFVSLRHSPPDQIVTASVVSDLLVHDIDLALQLCDGTWDGTASGSLWREPSTGIAEIADCSLRTHAGAVATLSASRMGQRKVRSIELATPGGGLELDLLRQTITVYRHLRHSSPGDGAYRAQTAMDIPFVRGAGEPLALQLEHFVRLAHGDEDAAAERGSLLPPHEVAARVEPADARAARGLRIA